MRLLYEFRFRQIGDTYLATAVGQNAHLFNGVLQLNEVGHFIVSQLAKLSSAEDNTMSAETSELTEEEILLRLTAALTNEYAVDQATAQTAVQNVLNYLKTEHVLA